MATKKLEETSICSNLSKVLAESGYILPEEIVPKIVMTIFHGVSRAIGSCKSVSTPTAIVFKSMNNKFIAAACVRYIKNKDDPDNPASGRWDYSWTVNEEDVKDFNKIDAIGNPLVMEFIASSGAKLYTLRFNDGVCPLATISSLEIIINWLKDNATDSDITCVTLDRAFVASSEVDKSNGKINIGIVPDGEMKILIKDDSSIQEN